MCVLRVDHASIKSAMSLALLAIGPAEPNSQQVGQIPSWEIRRNVGFMAKTSFRDAGPKMDPLASVATEAGARPAATAAAEPEEDPPTAYYPHIIIVR